MKISKYLAEIFIRDPFLYRVGLFMFITSVLLLLPLSFDNRILLGINPWIKPIKFCLSVGIYLFTIAWFLEYIKLHKKTKKLISYVTGISMIIEILIIIFQAMRGVKSHFNEDSDFDQILFGMMGLLIAITTIMVVIYFITLFFGQSSISGSYRLSILISIIIFLVASGVGGIMIANGAHTVGAADGGKGILFFNWSTEFGDLRIAHFIGMHAIQIIPFSCYVLLSKINNVKIVNIVLALICIVYSLLVSALYFQAQSGQPLIPR